MIDIESTDNNGQVKRSIPMYTLHFASVLISGQTALHFVASKNNLDVARIFFDNKLPASARVRDKRGQYPLHRAAAVGSIPMINLLVKNKSPLNATDSTGYTALHHAIAEGHGKNAT